MAQLAAALPLAGSVIGGIGQLQGANASASASNTQAQLVRQAAINQSQFYGQAANEALAEGGRQGEEASLQKQMVLSKARAVSAASGGGAADTSVANVETQIANRGDFDKLMALYQGQTKANLLRTQGQNALIGGLNQANADNYNASMTRDLAPLSVSGTILGGAGSFFQKYAENLKDDNSSSKYG